MISAQETPFLSLWSAPKPQFFLIGAAPRVAHKRIMKSNLITSVALHGFKCFLHADLKGSPFPSTWVWWREKRLSMRYWLPGGHLIRFKLVYHARRQRPVYKEGSFLEVGLDTRVILSYCKVLVKKCQECLFDSLDIQLVVSFLGQFSWIKTRGGLEPCRGV